MQCVGSTLFLWCPSTACLSRVSMVRCQHPKYFAGMSLVLAAFSSYCGILWGSFPCFLTTLCCFVLCSFFVELHFCYTWIPYTLHILPMLNICSLLFLLLLKWMFGFQACVSLSDHCCAGYSPAALSTSLCSSPQILGLLCKPSSHTQPVFLCIA